MNVQPSFISTIDNTIISCNRLRSNALHHYWPTLKIQKKHKCLPDKWKWIERPGKLFARLNLKTKKAQLGRYEILKLFLPYLVIDSTCCSQSPSPLSLPSPNMSD